MGAVAFSAMIIGINVLIGSARAEGIAQAIAPGISAFIVIFAFMPFVRGVLGKKVPPVGVYFAGGFVWVITNTLLRSLTIFGGTGFIGMEIIRAPDFLVITLIEAITVVIALVAIDLALGARRSFN